jgi:segregation and condensation protein B
MNKNISPEASQELAHEMRILEAILFASPEPLTLEMLQQQLGEETDVMELLGELKAHYAPHGVNLVETDGQWSFRTAADLAGHMKITRQPRRKYPL